jgi:hypothetical protein
MAEYMAKQEIEHVAKDSAKDVAEQSGEHMPEGWAKQSMEYIQPNIWRNMLLNKTLNICQDSNLITRLNMWLNK